jgi:tetratricopeptide (TPR) repeat protein
MKKIKLLLFFILLAPLYSISAIADETTMGNMYQITASEARLLPPFCLGLSAGNYREDAQSLRQKVTVPGNDTHHFCHGMKEIIRGDRGDKKSYERAVQEFEYVQGRSSMISQNELLDSTSLYKAEALGKLGKTGPAITEYNKAIQLNNKYHQAYARLADYYLSLGMKQDAIDTIKVGLGFSPESKGLRNRLHKLTEDK